LLSACRLRASWPGRRLVLWLVSVLALIYAVKQIAAFLFVAQYLQLVLGMDPLQAGLWTLPSSAGLVVGSLFAPLLVRFARPASVIAASLVLMAIGFGTLTQLNGMQSLDKIVTGSVLFSLGIAVVGTLATDLIVATAPPERAGTASGLSETSSEPSSSKPIRLPR
jgi:DHA2 family multidrug resistance protein-like MFS transporter